MIHTLSHRQYLPSARLFSPLCSAHLFILFHTVLSFHPCVTHLFSSLIPLTFPISIPPSLPHTHCPSGDTVLALNTTCKSLSISVQLAGLDSQNAAQHHGQVAALLAELGTVKYSTVLLLSYSSCLCFPLYFSLIL